MKQVKVSFLGLGVVGTQMMEFVRSNRQNIRDKYQVEVIIDKVYVRDTTKKRKVDVTGLTLTDDPFEAIEQADVVVECIGGNGVEMTREVVLSALSKGKSVIMSSKKCLAKYGEEIVKTANENHANLRYDATVGGGIPVSMVLDNMGKCEEIDKMYGICNATSNFILTQMTEQGMAYEEALSHAQKIGIAENDPTEDVDGFDSLYKAIIMCGFGMEQWIDYETVQPSSITTISPEQIKKAKEQDSVIKSVFLIEKKGDEITCSVGPKLFHKNTMIANVADKNNIIIINGSESGERAFYGLGAGARPTASAMYDDFIKVIRNYRELKNSMGKFVNIIA